MHCIFVGLEVIDRHPGDLDSKMTDVVSHKGIQPSIAGTTDNLWRGEFGEGGCVLPTAWSPALRRVRRAVRMAPMPEEKRRVPSAPSSLAMTLAAASTVGLPHRLYK